MRAPAGTFDEACTGLDYFTANRERMASPKFRALEPCVTTGVVEGACKSIIGNRLKRGSVHWSVDGANAIIAVRCAITSSRFDDYRERQAATSCPRSRGPHHRLPGRHEGLRLRNPPPTLGAHTAEVLDEWIGEATAEPAAR